MIEIYSFDNFSLYTSKDNFKLYKSNSKTKIEVVDNDGYKYSIARYNVYNIKRRKTYPARFFNLNPYTEYNIRLYLENISNNNVILENFNNADNAHSALSLYNKSQDIHYNKSWNEISTGRYYYKTLEKDYIPSRRLDYTVVENYLKDNQLIMVGEYKNNLTPIEFMCEKHKDKGIQKMNWSTIRKSPCPCKYCKSTDTRAKTDEQFKEEIRDLKNPNIEVIGKYTRHHEKIECKCNKCGRTIYLRPDHIRRGIGCGQCTKSIGEDRVEQFLLRNNILYKREYRFHDCIRVQRSLPFDFYIPNINTAIEFDGIQHFQAVDKFRGKENFKELKLNDEFKTNYCKENNINLIRISYKDIDRVDEILSTKLTDL